MYHTRIHYERPEWLTVMRPLAGSDDHSAVMDLGTLVPGLIQNTDAILSQPTISPAQAQETLARLRGLKEQFNLWLQRTKDHQSACWLGPTREIPGDAAAISETAPFGTAFQAAEIQHLYNFMLYNLLVANLLRTALQLHLHRTSALEEADQQDELSPEQAEAFRTALEDDYRVHLALLVQCVPAMLRPASNTCAWQLVAASLWFARNACREAGLEAAGEWCDDVAAASERLSAVGGGQEPDFEAFPPLFPAE